MKCWAALLVALLPATLSAQPIRELRAHSDTVYAVAFHPDGRHFASASFDRSVLLWNAARQRTGSVGPADARVVSVKYAPDGSLLACGDLRGGIHVCDAHTGSELHHLQGEPACVHALEFSGHTLIAGCADGRVCLWDCTQTNSQPRLLSSSTTPVFALALTVDGRTLAVGGNDGRIRLLDLPAGTVQATLEGHAGPVYALAFSLDGKHLVSGGEDATVRLWNADTRAAEACCDGHSDPVYHVSITQDSRRLISAGKGGQVIVWDADTRRPIYSHRFPGHTTCAALAPDGTVLAVGTERGSCFLLELPEHIR